MKNETKKNSSDRNVLPIELSPPNEDAFKARLLETRRAKMTIVYIDDRREPKIKIWRADKFSETSHLWRNLRSRTECRRKYVQERGVKYVSFKVISYDIA